MLRAYARDTHARSPRGSARRDYVARMCARRVLCTRGSVHELHVDQCSWLTELVGFGLVCVRSATSSSMSQETLGIPSGLEGLDEEYDLVIIGAGLSGGVIAERASKELGLKVLLMDKRDHIGGNCFDFIDEHGFRISRYGVHLFHTVHQRVWDYVNRFSEWMPYEHRVKGRVDGKIVPIPPSQTTVNMLFDANVNSVRASLCARRRSSLLRRASTCVPQL
jgi:hypothetical protein